MEAIAIFLRNQQISFSSRRLVCVIGIVILLALRKSESATQASCPTSHPTYSIVHSWTWNDQKMNLETCWIEVSTVNDESFTIATTNDRSTLAFSIRDKKGVKFLPTNFLRAFPELIVLEVWNCSVTSVKNHFKGLSKLKSLNLFANKIDQITSDAFVDLVRLERLNLGQNKIRSLGNNIFATVRALKGLFLHSNEIASLLPDVFSSLVNVKEIFLQNNKIVSIDERIFEKLTNLKDIYLRANKLESIPKDLFKNNLKLENIWLDTNKIKFGDANMVAHLQNLKLVNLKGNVCISKSYSAGSFDALKRDLKQTCSSAAPGACGVSKILTPLIVFGQSFTHGSYPWIVALLHTGYRPHQYFCSGTLISKTFVISGEYFKLNPWIKLTFLISQRRIAFTRKMQKKGSCRETLSFYLVHMTWKIITKLEGSSFHPRKSSFTTTGTIRLPATTQTYRYCSSSKTALASTHSFSQFVCGTQHQSLL